MKKVLSLVLLVVILVLAWVLYRQFASKIEFDKERTVREAAIVQRLKDIRSSQRAFKQVNQRFTGSFDTLINFVLHDSMTYIKAIGSEDDSLAVAQGRVRMEEFKIPVKDTLFGRRGYTAQDIRNFEMIPFSDNEKFIMDATTLITESGFEVPVFEARAPFKSYLYDLDKQELINLIDETNTIDRYPGLKVGSLTQTNNDAGNWE